MRSAVNANGGMDGLGRGGEAVCPPRQGGLATLAVTFDLSTKLHVHQAPMLGQQFEFFAIRQADGAAVDRN